MKRLLMTICLILATAGAHAADLDKRQVLRLTQAQKNLVLEEMRGMLSATQGILGALSTNDMAVVAQQARAVGMAMAHKSEDHLKGALPPAFMQLGMSAHQDFDQIAADAETKKDPKHTLKQLSESMKKCIACHDTYQIRVVQRRKAPQ